MKLNGYDISKVKYLYTHDCSMEHLEDEFKNLKINTKNINILNIVLLIDDISVSYDYHGDPEISSNMQYQVSYIEEK